MGVDFREFIGLYTDPNYLEHHGVLGMKWGVRRYQNKDGSLTERGRARMSKVASNSLVTKLESNKAKNLFREKAKVAKNISDYYNERSDIARKRAQKAKKKEDKYAQRANAYAQKAKLNEETFKIYKNRSENFLRESLVMNKKINDIDSGKMKAGRDFITQTDIYFLPIDKEAFRIPVYNRIAIETEVIEAKKKNHN